MGEYLNRIELRDRNGDLRRLEIKYVERPWEFRQLVDIQASAWKMGKDRTDATPSHVLRAASDNSGIVIGAFDLDTGHIVGFAWGFLARDSKGLYHYSHQSAIIEELKYSGLGFRIKQTQREVALSQGLDRAKWTFDPLQGLNTRFNLGKLGVVSWNYIINYYGEMNDAINRGLRSDRLKAWWFLNSERVRRKARRELKSPSLREALEAGAVNVLEFDSDIPSGFRKVDNDLVLVEIPYSVNEARSKGIADRWREYTAEAMIHYMSLGYIDFEAVYERESKRIFHLLWRRPLEEILEGELPK